MFNNLKILTLTACTALALQSCHSDDDSHFTESPDGTPVLTGDINSYAALRANDSINSLFALAGKVAQTGEALGDEPCQVKLHKITYDTVGGAGEATTSTGVVMVPYGEDALCAGDRPVVLYAHGTTADRNYDLSQFAADPTNPAASEAAVILAFYAAQGNVVIAPNYAGYADSTLGYHPYVDEVQQSTEMIDALEHVRTHASSINASLSSKLFVTGVSQGGYVAMATHKALQAKGEAVLGSAPISGPYAMGIFLDAVMGGTVNGGATTFAPMYLTALEKAHDIYESESEVYAVAGAENSLPAPGKTDGVSAGLPAALFSAQGQTAPYSFGYGDEYLLAESFRLDYKANKDGSTDVNAASKVRDLAYEADMKDWTPTAPVAMCGTSNDPVVYHAANSGVMAGYWSDLVAAKAVLNIDLMVDPDPSSPADEPDLQDIWISKVADGDAWAGQVAVAIAEETEIPKQPEGSISPADRHGQTGVYCAAVALGLLKTVLATPE